MIPPEKRLEHLIHRRTSAYIGVPGGNRWSFHIKNFGIILINATFLTILHHKRHTCWICKWAGQTWNKIDPKFLRTGWWTAQTTVFSRKMNTTSRFQKSLFLVNGTSFVNVERNVLITVRVSQFLMSNFVVTMSDSPCSGKYSIPKVYREPSRDVHGSQESATEVTDRVGYSGTNQERICKIWWWFCQKGMKKYCLRDFRCNCGFWHLNIRIWSLASGSR